MNRMLLIVDPQVDFVTGSLKVAGAEKAMDSLAAYMRRHGCDYAACVITADWHPATHISFAGNGGPWPRHCVAYSVGAAIYPPVYDAALSCCAESRVLLKGLDPKHEEYSIFSNAASALLLDEIIDTRDIGKIDVCGLAGDVCVCATLADGISRYGREMFHVLERFSPSIDGGAALNELIMKFRLRCDR